MGVLDTLYRPSLALLTDLYQLTMAEAYWHAGLAEREAVFQLSFRKSPFGGGYTVAAGLEYAIDFLNAYRFTDDDLHYLAGLTGNNEQPLFDADFLQYLKKMRFSCQVDAIPEGTVVFPHEPLMRVQGPILQAQLLETPLLNLVNFQTLLATKAARVCQVAGDEPVLEFGLRRAQGMDGALAASRAAFIGGCAATSNVLAGRLFDIPVKGTHAHSWVMCFDSEPAAFDAFAEALPNNCIFLVDTYDTLQGVRHAIAAGARLRARGHEMIGIRLDSGDLAYLSIEARKLLDEGGFPDAKIVASSDLDEHLIESLHRQGAKVAVWGVGTKLVTAFDDPALGGIYKLSAIRNTDGGWDYKVKLSEQLVKTSMPGLLQVRRYRSEQGFIADALYNLPDGLAAGCTIVDPNDMTRRRRIPDDADFEDLLVPIFRDGACVYEQPGLPELQQRARDQLAGFHPSIKRLENPHDYPAGLERRLHDLRTKLVMQYRGTEDES
jgi:nicotinate phosphoribosyltransferase